MGAVDQREREPLLTIDNPFGMEDRLVHDLRTPHERCTMFQGE